MTKITKDDLISAMKGQCRERQTAEGHNDRRVVTFARDGFHRGA